MFGDDSNYNIVFTFNYGSFYYIKESYFACSYFGSGNLTGDCLNFSYSYYSFFYVSNGVILVSYLYTFWLSVGIE